MYHSISLRSTASFQRYTVAPDLFSAHIDFLAEAGYHTVTMAELAAMRSGRAATSPPMVALTFDDAFRDFAVNGLPVLSAAGLRATLFVPTGFVGGTSRWLVSEGEQRRELLSWAELVDVASAGVECGAHSHSHPQLDLLDRRTAAREISLSKALLEDHLQSPVVSFAYPFGYSDAAVRDLVGRLGFTSACAVADLPSDEEDNLFAIPRLTITSDVTPARLAAILARPRRRFDEINSAARALASRALRTARVKKRANAPGRAPRPDQR
jgi:peptidoglycan/xylan/chitin deacetylase (PgdA/CDA1 family)